MNRALLGAMRCEDRGSDDSICSGEDWDILKQTTASQHYCYRFSIVWRFATAKTVCVCLLVRVFEKHSFASTVTSHHTVLRLSAGQGIISRTVGNGMGNVERLTYNSALMMVGDVWNVRNCESKTDGSRWIVCVCVSKPGVSQTGQF